MIIQLSDHDEQARCALSQHLASWEGLLVAGLRRMQAAGTLQPTADPEALATGLIGALQGGYLLAQANRDAAAMGTALDMALAHVESLSRDGESDAPSRSRPSVSASTPTPARPD